MMVAKQKESKLFYNFSLSSRIPKDHFLRKLDEAVDFSVIRELARPYYSHTGQPSVDPVVLMKMILMGYLIQYHLRTKACPGIKGKHGLYVLLGL